MHINLSTFLAGFLLVLTLSGCATTAPPSCDGSDRRPVNAPAKVQP